MARVLIVLICLGYIIGYFCFLFNYTKDYPQCMWANDAITCVEIARRNKWALKILSQIVQTLWCAASAYSLYGKRVYLNRKYKDIAKMNIYTEWLHITNDILQFTTQNMGAAAVACHTTEK